MPSLRNIILTLGLAVLPYSLWATNGMNLEGYGPVSSAMGGTAMAYDNGTAAMMGNPATLALGSAGHRLDLALGHLGPNVSASFPTAGLTANSQADSFYMPAAGWMHQRGKHGYGLGVFAQGGMGTEYASGSFMSNPGQLTPSPALVNRSEVSVGRAMLPLTYDVSSQLHIGGTLDFVWAGIDLKMAMSESQFQDLANPMSQQQGTASGSLVTAFGGLYQPFGGSGISQLHHAYFDFSNYSDYTGEAQGFGWGAKLGLVYEVSPNFSIGASYHAKTRLADLESDNAQLSMSVNIDSGIAAGGAPSNNYVDATLPLNGTIKINNFQWPALFGVGAALRPNSRWLVTADIKRIQWSDVMQRFDMEFTSSDSPQNGGFANTRLEASLFQKWRDQTVYALGGAYQASAALTLRAGVNIANNPVPDTYLNALFPAITKEHVSAGFGYALNQVSNIDLSISHALPVKVDASGGIRSEHAQTNWQLMYVHRW